MIRFKMRNLWNAVWKTRRRASRVSEGMGDVRDDLRPVRVCCLYGLGFGSDVTIVLRLDDD
jgi:hypothetical protein